MLARLAAKTVAVTGGCSGIGLAVAKRCALAGARRIFIGDLTGGTSACISAVQHEFQQLGLNKTFDELVKISSVDVTNPASVDCWIRSIIEETGGLDLAANIAGLAQSAYSRPSPAILHENDEEWARVLGVNLTGIFYCTKAEINAMMLGQRGRDSGRSTVVSEVENCNMSESSVCHRCSIVNMASLTACYPLADIYAYGSSKAAVKHFTSSVARDVWKHGIRVNAVSPGKHLISSFL